MNTIGFVISGKKNERRRALLPLDIVGISNARSLYFERGYALHLGIPDEEYSRLGCRVVGREEVYSSDVICNPKTPEDWERAYYRGGQVLFGWIHAVQGRSIVDFLLAKQMTAIAWEDMFEEGRHCFWRNNEMAGEAAVLHALQYFGRSFEGCHAALIGLGNCGRGAFRTLSRLGALVRCFDRKTEGLLRSELSQFDIVVNAVLWDVFRSDHMIYLEDLERMRPGSMIIDISCDSQMGIETSRPTSLADPVYEISGVIHYAVDHTPTLFYKETTQSISKVIGRYVDQLVEGHLQECLRRATVIQSGMILDERITRYQRREGGVHRREATTE